MKKGAGVHKIQLSAGSRRGGKNLQQAEKNALPFMAAVRKIFHVGDGVVIHPQVPETVISLCMWILKIIFSRSYPGMTF